LIPNIRGAQGVGNVLFAAGRCEETLRLYDRSLAIDHSRGALHHNKGVCCNTWKECRRHYFTDRARA
jgi:hypothetical protein